MASDVVLSKAVTGTRRCEDKKRKSLKFSQSAEKNIVTVSYNILKVLTINIHL